jgi:hypothetical protein
VLASPIVGDPSPGLGAASAHADPSVIASASTKTLRTREG